MKLVNFPSEKGRFGFMLGSLHFGSNWLNSNIQLARYNLYYVDIIRVIVNKYISYIHSYVRYRTLA